jgi:hypothetical protein
MAGRRIPSSDDEEKSKMIEAINQEESPDCRHVVDARSDELWAEFERHYDEFIAAYPDKTDEVLIFQGWILQKVAGLQVSVMELARQVDELTTAVAEEFEYEIDPQNLE